MCKAKEAVEADPGGLHSAPTQQGGLAEGQWEVVVLGTAAAVPTKYRGATGRCYALRGGQGVHFSGAQPGHRVHTVDAIARLPTAAKTTAQARMLVSLQRKVFSSEGFQPFNQKGHLVSDTTAF